jgi:elongation factor 2 kinase
MTTTATFIDKNDSNASSTTTTKDQQQGETLSSRIDYNSKKKSNKLRLISLLKKAAAAEVAKGDPWAKYEMHTRVPAELVVRHLYHASSKSWTCEETIVKMEAQPFTHGAMRYCYRLKKRSALPDSASNHRFHDYGWTRASNYVAKAYHTNDITDTSEQAKEAVRNDVSLQYEAAHWADRFNAKNPPKSIIFIRTYALEFPNRPGRPWFAVERFISGNDMYGCGFVKHNTNSGFVDNELEHRVTPQVFSAFSFYESDGERLVADIQGVGDLYTDPQGK